LDARNDAPNMMGLKNSDYLYLCSGARRRGKLVGQAEHGHLRLQTRTGIFVSQLTHNAGWRSFTPSQKSVHDYQGKEVAKMRAEAKHLREALASRIDQVGNPTVVGSSTSKEIAALIATVAAQRARESLTSVEHYMASSSEASVQDASSLSEKELLQLEMLQLENDHLRYASYLFSSSVRLNSMLDPVKVVHCSASSSTCCGWQWGYQPRWSGHAVRGQEWDAQTMQTLVTLPTQSVGTFNTRGALTAPCRH
jgi:hypothetical protein